MLISVALLSGVFVTKVDAADADDYILEAYIGQDSPAKGSDSTEDSEIKERIRPENVCLITEAEDEYFNLRNEIVEYALTFVGNKYVLGGNSLENGTDCSGFTRLIYGEYGYSIGKVANDQYHNVNSVSSEDLKPGDLVFYGRKGHASHVAMYMGDGMIVHAANSKRGITTDRITYMKNVIGYGRPI